MNCQCGQSILLAEKKDADKEAIEDLTKQAKSQRGPLATLTRARRDQLKAEVSAETAFKKTIKAANSSLLKTIKAASQSALIWSIQSYDDEQLVKFILESGYGLAVDEYIDQADKIRQTVKRTFEAIDPNFDFGEVGNQLDAIQSVSAQAVFDEVILPDVKQSINQGVRDLMADVPVEIVVSNLQARLERSEGRQLTEVKTRISQFGRGITSATAEAAGLDHYLYTGPKDGITRPFCRALISLVVDQKQMNKLNNGQGLAVITGGGGYNCRHSWSPVTEGFMEAAQLTKATQSDISKANRGAKRK